MKNEVNSLRILLSGGGTAGHINPAVAIAKYAIEQDKNTEVLFVGTKMVLKAVLFPRKALTLNM